MGETSNRNSKNQRKTFPKEGEKRLKDIIQKLKERNRYLEKKIKFYEKTVIHHETLRDTKKSSGPINDLALAEIREEARKQILKQFRESLKERAKNDTV